MLPERCEHLTAGDIRNRIQPFFLRRRKQDVFKELPDKLRSDEWLEMEEDQQAEYDSILSTGRDEFTSGEKEFTRIHALALLTKLKQVCNFTVDGDESAKATALEEQIDEIVANDKKVLVFSQWKERGTDRLAPILKKHGLIVITGDTPPRERTVAVARFQEDPNTRVFLATAKTAGEGITLTAASYVIHFDHWWNPAVAWQAEDRAHRHGQTETVNVYSYWMKGTVEERIHRILQRKGLLHEQIVNALSEKEIEEALSIDDLLEVLQLDKSRVKIPTSEIRRAPAIVNNVELLRQSKPDEFERIVQRIFRDVFGYSNARVIGGPGDGGVDIEATKSVPGGVERIVVQCKRTETVGPDKARDLMGVLSADPSLAKGYLVTSGVFSRACKEWCRNQGQIALINGMDLARLMQENPEATAAESS